MLEAPQGTEGLGNQADTSIGCTDAPSIETNTLKARSTPDIFSIPRKRGKPPDPPSQAAKQTPDKPDSCRRHADGSSMCMDVQSIAHETETAVNVRGIVRMHTNGSKMKTYPPRSQMAAAETEQMCRDGTDGTDVQSVGNGRKTAVNRTEFGIHQYMSKQTNSTVLTE